MKKFTAESVVRTSSVLIFYYVSFYPYSQPEDPQIFATVGDNRIVIASCGATPNTVDTNFEILATYVDENPKESLCSVCWTQDGASGRPLIAVGGKTGTIKIVDSSTGKLVRTLCGHGDEILDLQACPTHPHIIASTSGDHTIRVWNLDHKYKANPCAIICAGQGHHEQVLTVSFHDSGRFLASGGMDNQVHLWVLPDLSTLPMHKDDPIVLYWSHFSTNALHSNYVDSIAFYGDLLLSRAAKENKIVLWRIDGFNSSIVDKLSQENAPTNHDRQRDTLSAFGQGFTRLLQFSTTNAAPWYMRFGKITGLKGFPPLLAMGNDAAKVYIFDLESLELGAAKSDEGESQHEADDDLTKVEEAIDKPPTPAARRGRLTALEEDEGEEYGDGDSEDPEDEYIEEDEDEDAGADSNESEEFTLSGDSRKRNRRKRVRAWSAAREVKRRSKRRKRYQRDKKNRALATSSRNSALLTSEDDGGSEYGEETEGQLEKDGDDENEEPEVKERAIDIAKKVIHFPAESETEISEDVFDSEHAESASAGQTSARASVSGVGGEYGSEENKEEKDAIARPSDEEIVSDDESSFMPDQSAEVQRLKVAVDVDEDQPMESIVISSDSEGSSDEALDVTPSRDRNSGPSQPVSPRQRLAMVEYLESAWQTVGDYLEDVYPSGTQHPARLSKAATEKRESDGDVTSREGPGSSFRSESVSGSMSESEARSDSGSSLYEADKSPTEPKESAAMSSNNLLSYATSLASNAKPDGFIGNGTSAIADPFEDIQPQVVLDIPRSRRLIRHLAFSPNGKYLVAVGDGGTICVWGVE